VGFLGNELPDLTRLQLTVHETPDSSTRTLTVSWLANTQQLLLEDFEAACIDAALKHAHAAGHMPVGPMWVATEQAVYEQKPLVEGRPMARSIEDMQIDHAMMAGDLVQVRCSVELGLSL
jgi:hypothetical protein